MKTKYLSYVSAISRLIPVFIILASLLVLPKVQAAIGSTFTIDQLKYTVLTEEPASQTGTVSVVPIYKEISGDITIPASVANGGIKYSVTFIPLGAFQNYSRLSGITIPDSVTSIGDSAFYGCSKLTTIVIPNGVTSIGGSAFYNCSSLTSIIIPNGVTSIGGSAFYGCSSLTSIIIPDSVTSIGYYAFYGCSKLTTIVISDNVTFIADFTFSGCTNLTSIIIPDGVTSIDGNAFYGCIKLANIAIPEGVISIGDAAFYGCSSLTNAIIGNSVITIGGSAFSNCSSLTSVVIGNGVTSIGGSAFYNCGSLTSIIIPDSVTSIGGVAFCGCTNLTSIIIPDGVTSIGGGAFAGCSGLKSVTIGNGVTSICERAFGGCTNLTSIVIPDRVTSIESVAFSGCSGLTNIVIPNSVTLIGAQAFYGCSSLVSIIIPKSVTSIGYEAFQSCSSLTDVYFEGNAPQLSGGNAFFAPAVVYYRPGTTGWTNPWMGLPATLWIESLKIAKQPQSHAVMEGDSITFDVIAEGTAPLSYQWYKEGTILEGATGASYTIESVSAGDLGNYMVVVSNELGEATSDIAVLSYLMPPTITVPPVSLTVDAWSQASFEVEALGADSYQWYRNDIPISGATGALYTIDSAKGIDVGTYKVIITNRTGITSSSATLALTQPYRATGTVQVVNGYVVGLTVIDGGWGYTRPPNIRIIDETGTGATGHCVIENRVITQIIVDNPGSKYSGEATLLIESPFSSDISLKISVSKPNEEVKIEAHLNPGMEYRLWSSADCINWEQVEEPFIAGEEEITFFFKVEGSGRFFKLQEI